jgi:hypothetical protein
MASEEGINPNEYREAGANVANGIGYSRSIDSYLNAHTGDEKVKICAKLAIVKTILESERTSSVFIDGSMVPHEFQNRTVVMASWLNAFMYLLSEGVQKNKNIDGIFENVSIVNFNYDRCIEQFLYLALQQLFVIREDRAAELLSKLTIIHPYGIVGNLPWQGGLRVPFGSTIQPAELIKAAQKIRTFNEQIDDDALLTRLSQVISEAKRIVFLGSHFHNQNMALLKSVEPARGGEVRVFGTAFNRSSADVTIIDRQIRTMLKARGGTWDIQILRQLDCSGLFKEFGTTLMR